MFPEIDPSCAYRFDPLHDELPFSFKEGGTWTAVLLVFGGILGFAAQSLSFFTSQRVHPSLFSLTGQFATREQGGTLSGA